MNTFHDWLIGQTSQDNAVGDIARDYERGVAQGLHGEVTSPDELRVVVRRFVEEGSDADLAVDEVEHEWSDCIERIRIK